MAFKRIDIAPRYQCASGDAKTTAGIPTGATLDETDTNKQYRFNGVAWVEKTELSLPAGTALIGKVGIDQSTANANNVVVKSNAGKSSASTTRPDDATPYHAGDVVGTANANMTFANVLGTAAQQFIITGVTLEIDVAAVPAGMGGFKLYLYDANPTVIADHAAYNLPSGDRAKLLGVIPISTPTDLGDTLWSQNDNINFNGKLAVASTSLYGILTTDNVYTPTNLAVKTVTIYAIGV